MGSTKREGKMKKILELIGLVLVIGCAGMTPQQQETYSSTANTPLYCQGGEDCEVKWGAALQWILQNSYWKVRTQSESLIQTEGPLDTVYLAYQVQKIPIGNNRYEITMNLGCGNPFTCVPNPLQAKADFVSFVSARGGSNPTSHSDESTTSNGDWNPFIAGIEPQCGKDFIVLESTRNGQRVWRCMERCKQGTELHFSDEKQAWECR